MKPIKTKLQIRAELEAQVERFLKGGGEVNSIPQGVSGNEGNLNAFQRGTSFEPKSDRTPLTELVKGLEERKHPSRKTQQTLRPQKPRKKLITDDFGEPIRWVWVDKD